MIARGTSDELKASIGGQRVEINLVSSEDSPVAREILGRLGSSEPTVSDDGRELTVKAEDAPAALRLILAEFGSRGIRLYDAGMRRPTLDDVFLRLTGHAATEEEPADAVDSGGGRATSREARPAGRRADGERRVSGRRLATVRARPQGSEHHDRHDNNASRAPIGVHGLALRWLDHHAPQPDQDQAGAGHPRVHDPAADHVRAAVHLYLRRSDRRSRAAATRNSSWPGIFAQTVVFGSTYSGSAMAQDLKDGIIDRFRSLPMSPSAVLIGRTNGDLLINAMSMVVMMTTGFIVGWRVNSSFLEGVAGVALLLLFAYALSWVMAFLGMLVRSPEVINNVSFLVLFPLTFISSAFVPIDTLPTPLRIFAEYNPVSALIQAARELFGNVPPGTPVPDVWTLQNPVPTVLIGVVVVLFVFVPLAVRKFKQISTR